MQRIQRFILGVASKSGFLCSVYYALCSASFWREHRGVIHGRLKHMREARDPLGGRYILRRNVHLLEKGLLMRPRHGVFALDYIQETVDCYARACELVRASPELMSRIELQWPSDVLTRYFEVVGSHPIIDELRDRFRALQAAVPDRPPAAVPYRRDLVRPPPVKYEDLLELARRRRTVRRFLQ